ncbi:MAG: YdeI/OmpD-associated family protein [Actinomycetota bacterium]
MKPRFFTNPAQFRAWLERNHQRATELWVGFHKKGSGKPSITWPEAVDQALCFGWIDGVRRSIDETSYTNRFTPRKPRSTWSAINVKRAKELVELGLMQPAGLNALKARQENRTGIYPYEQRPQNLPPGYERKVKANRRAWEFWHAQPLGYRKAATWWVISAKREETRERRLDSLIETSARAERIPSLVSPSRRDRRKAR